MSKTDGTVTASFVYNADGLRVQKTVNGIVTKYILHGKNITHLIRGNDELHFFYDASGSPAMVEWNNGTTVAKYAYVKNLQGDIVAILDDTGAEVVKYTYDAWGTPVSTIGTMATTLGSLNPFRYRGYVFDEEMRLYYLKNRYYNTKKLRFIHSDAVIDTNVYVYCVNNPANNVDSNGFGWCCCFDENGNFASPTSRMLMGGGGGCSGIGATFAGYSFIDEVRNMDEEDWINEGKIIGGVLFSCFSSIIIAKVAKTAGSAYMSCAIETGFGTGVGHFFQIVINCISYYISDVVESVVYEIFDLNKTETNKIETGIEHTFDLLDIFDIELEIPSPWNFIKNYVKVKYANQ